MRLLFIPLFLLLSIVSVAAQYCSDDNRFTEEVYFSEEQIELTRAIPYAVAENWQGFTDTLRYDMFSPAASSDLLERRPAVVLIHGGGFQNGERASLHEACYAFAKRGFVAITISYRLGWATEPQALAAVYRANQDARAALRHIFHHADAYGIDREWVFLGGRSAGSITALNAVYTDQTEYNALFPGVVNNLGALDQSGNSLTDSYRIRALFNNWGGLLAVFGQVEEMLPMISFHGELDTTVPIDAAANGLRGSRALHEWLTDNNVCSELMVDPTAGHGFLRDAMGIDFRVARVSCFFKSLFCETCVERYTTDLIAANCAEVVALEEPAARIEVGVYPNPFRMAFSVSGIPAEATVELWNMPGQLVYRADNTRAHHRVPDLASGLYLLRLRYQGQSYTRKLIKY